MIQFKFRDRDFGIKTDQYNYTLLELVVNKKKLEETGIEEKYESILAYCRSIKHCLEYLREVFAKELVEKTDLQSFSEYFNELDRLNQDFEKLLEKVK